MTRVVVHIGAQRTGSEAIHRGLYVNQEVLARRGVLVPLTGRHDESPRAVRHHALARCLDPSTTSPHDAKLWETLAAEINASDASTALLSSGLFAPVAADPTLVPLMLERLRGLSDDITLVLFVREQLGLLNSLYRSRVKALETAEDFDTYLEQSADVRLYDLASFRDWYVDPPAKFVAVPWNEDGEGNALSALLAATDVEVDPSELLAPEEILGEHLGPIGVEATRMLVSYLRERFPDYDPTEHAARRLKRRASTQALAQGWCDDEFWGWSTPRAHDMVARYAGSNQEFARHCWGTDWSLSSPLERPRNVADLADQPPAVVRRVHAFAHNMERRFMRVRAVQEPS